MAEGDRAMADGRYEAALAHYDEALLRGPLDRVVRKRRNAARQAWVDKELDNIASLRRLSHWQSASARVGRLLTRTKTWTLTEAQRRQVSEAVGQSAASDAEGVLEILRSSGPLAAQQAWPDVGRLKREPPYRAARLATLETIRAGARERCEGFGAPEEPYLAMLAGYYCRSFGVPGPDVSIPPGTCSALTFEGDIDGATTEEAQELRRELSKAFVDGPLFDPRAECSIHIKLEGSRRDSHAARRATRTAVWHEHITTETNTTGNGTQATRYETYSVPCRNYADPPRACEEAATKPESELYEVVRRSYDYEVIEHVYRYTAHTTFRVDSTPNVVGSFGLRRVTYQDEHDVTDPDAGIVPKEPDPPTREERFLEEIVRARDKLEAGFNEVLRRRYCRAPNTDRVDDAAACVLLRKGDAPKTMVELIGRRFQDDHEAIAGLVPERPWRGLQGTER